MYCDFGQKSLEADDFYVMAWFLLLLSIPVLMNWVNLVKMLRMKHSPCKDTEA